jgi:AAA+ ATPase superfamily predicted ATPase
MNAFHDREIELATLESLYAQDGGTLLILYGRRRVGKTTLIQRFLEGKRGLYLLATEESGTENLGYFRSLVADFLGDDLVREAVGLSWEKLAARFTTATGKKVLVIDEFQYLCTSNPAFSSLMQRMYDTVLKPAGVMVVLCGSYIRMMESETLNYDSPLYGRRDGRIRLTQIPFRYFGDFLPGRSEDERIQYFAVTGGVPRYIEMMTHSSDLQTAIDERILDPQSMLFEEPFFLLSHEVRDIGSYFTLLKTLAAGHRRPSEIAATMQIKQTSLSKLLSALMQLDLVERTVPVTEENPEKSKKGLYSIKDHFLSFWFRFVFPYRSSLSMRDFTHARENLRQNFVSGQVSRVFEDICAEKLWALSEKGAFGGPLQKVAPWWDSRTEIDCVGLGIDRTTLVSAECRYSVHRIGPAVLADLKRKTERIPWNNDQRTEIFVLFSRSGFDASLEGIAASDPHVLLIGLDAERTQPERKPV